MENRKSKITLYDIVAIGLMAAFVFIATFFFKIKIPTPGGSTMVKLGNGICLLCGRIKCESLLSGRKSAAHGV